MRWVQRLLSATSPRSPLSCASLRICASCRPAGTSPPQKISGSEGEGGALRGCPHEFGAVPVAWARARVRRLSPMPSSSPSEGAPGRLRQRRRQGRSSPGDRASTERRKLLRVSMIFSL